MSALDRSVIFSALLDLSPEFGALTIHEGSTVITTVLAAWEQSPATDLYAFTSTWLSAHPL